MLLYILHNYKHVNQNLCTTNIYVVQDIKYESVSSINKFVIMVNQHYFSMKKNVLQIEIIIWIVKDM